MIKLLANTFLIIPTQIELRNTDHKNHRPKNDIPTVQRLSEKECPLEKREKKRNKKIGKLQNIIGIRICLHLFFTSSCREYFSTEKRKK